MTVILKNPHQKSIIPLPFILHLSNIVVLELLFKTLCKYTTKIYSCQWFWRFFFQKKLLRGIYTDGVIISLQELSFSVRAI